MAKKKAAKKKAVKKAAKKTAKKKASPSPPQARLAGTRYFELIAGKSKKFWEIDVSGKQVTTRYGRVGTDGQTTEKSFADTIAAQEHANKLIAEKTGKGYTETSRGVSAARQGFEEQLLENPDDVETLAVYADWLTEQGDPRGEFIHVQLALEDEKLSAKQRKPLKAKEKKLLKEHQEAWLGAYAPFLMDNPTVTVFGYDDERPAYHYRFLGSFLGQLDIGKLEAPLATFLRDSDECEKLVELIVESFAYDEDGDNPSLEILSQCRNFRNLRRFRVGQDHGDGRASCWVYVRPIVDLIAAMPRLEELHLLCKEFDIDRLFSLKSLRNLKVLRIYHYGARGADGYRARYEYPLDILAANSAFKNLTHLYLHPHYREAVEGQSFLPLDQVKAIVRSRSLKNLTHLQLRLSNMGDAGCQLLVESRFLGQLKWLDLRHGCITDDGARILAECPDLTGLEHLDLSGNALSRKGVAALKKTGVSLVADSQQTDEELADEAYLREGDFE